MSTYIGENSRNWLDVSRILTMAVVSFRDHRNCDCLSFVNAEVQYPCTPAFLRALD